MWSGLNFVEKSRIILQFSRQLTLDLVARKRFVGSGYAHCSKIQDIKLAKN